MFLARLERWIVALDQESVPDFPQLRLPVLLDDRIIRSFEFEDAALKEEPRIKTLVDAYIDYPQPQHVSLVNDELWLFNARWSINRGSFIIIDRFDVYTFEPLFSQRVFCDEVMPKTFLDVFVTPTVLWIMLMNTWFHRIVYIKLEIKTLKILSYEEGFNDYQRFSSYLYYLTSAHSLQNKIQLVKTNPVPGSFMDFYERIVFNEENLEILRDIMNWEELDPLVHAFAFYTDIKAVTVSENGYNFLVLSMQDRMRLVNIDFKKDSKVNILRRSDGAFILYTPFSLKFQLFFS